MKGINKIAILTLCLMCMLPVYLYGQRTKSSLSAGEQRYAEKGLKDNRYFFYFIDSSVTNFGTEKEKIIYKEAIQRDLIAQILYMKFNFKSSFIEIKKSQILLIRLYRLVLKRDIKMGKDLLNSFAKLAIHFKGHLPRHYLKLGYRELTHGKQYMIMADHYREYLYSYRLYKYVQAIKKAKYGKRYGLLAALSYHEKENFNPDTQVFNFDTLKKRLPTISKEKQDFYLAIHNDNYYLPSEEVSFFDQIWEKPDLRQIPEFPNYFKPD